jgi:hypothetical protein
VSVGKSVVLVQIAREDKIFGWCISIDKEEGGASYKVSNYSVFKSSCQKGPDIKLSEINNFVLSNNLEIKLSALHHVNDGVVSMGYPT